ncbi:MAG TPA: gamma-glutamylcyclotransferase [Tepidisphaeraceae bacterium]|nr:gamma-glutamylcyclotransferase [Tepidisphaeraceae bacterium]
MEKGLYFAYGSNMDPRKLGDRVGAVRKVGNATLYHRRFLINARGVATVKIDHSSRVWGVLWKLDASQFTLLDRYEGVRNGLYRRETASVEHGQSLARAMLYVAAQDESGEPREGYMELIVEAARRAAFPADYVEQLCTWITK